MKLEMNISAIEPLSLTAISKGFLSSTQNSIRLYYSECNLVIMAVSHCVAFKGEVI